MGKSYPVNIKIKALELYNSGLSASQVSKELNGPSKDIVLRWARESGFIRENKESIRLRNWRKYTLDEDIFERRPFTTEVAWALGVIVGDGCVMRHKGTIRGLLITCDKDVCEKVAKILGTDTPVRPPKNNNSNGCYILQVNNTRIGESLIKLGITPNKSHTVGFPENLKEEQVPHFIRGLWDADGCVTRTINNNIKLIYVSCSDLLLKTILDHMRTVTGTKSNVHWCKDGTGRVGLSCQMAIKWGDWLWGGSTEESRGYRKYDLFNKYKKSSGLKKRLWQEKCRIQREKARGLYRDGKTCREVADILGCNYKSVEKWVRDGGYR